MIFKSEDFTYPTKQERNSIIKELPEIEWFHFPECVFEKDVLIDGISIEEFSPNNNLYEWEILLINRVGKLTETYIMAIAHFKRGFPEKYPDCSKEETMNKYQFDFYSEVFFHFFYSTRETILQLLNVFLRVGIPEDKLNINHIINQKSNRETAKVVTEFNDSLKDVKKIRDSYTHRFPKNHSDHRTSVEGNTLSVFNGNVMKSKDLVNQMTKSLNALADLIVNLKSQIHSH